MRARLRRHNDQIGEIGRVVVLLNVKGAALESDSLMLCLMLRRAVEFAFGEARTVHPLSQILFERAGFVPAAFCPGLFLRRRARDFLLYAQLYGCGQDAACQKPPEVIPEVVRWPVIHWARWGFQTS